MSSTLGMIIDQLCTIDMKMWNAQENIYIIRKMDFNTFKETYFKDEQGAEKLWKILGNACDLNLQRNALIDEIDEKVIEMIDAKSNGEDLDNGAFLQRKHKTY